MSGRPNSFNYDKDCPRPFNYPFGRLFGDSSRPRSQPQPQPQARPRPRAQSFRFQNVHVSFEPEERSAPFATFENINLRNRRRSTSGIDEEILNPLYGLVQFLDLLSEVTTNAERWAENMEHVNVNRSGWREDLSMPGNSRAYSHTYFTSNPASNPSPQSNGTRTTDTMSETKTEKGELKEKVEEVKKEKIEKAYRWRRFKRTPTAKPTVGSSEPTTAAFDSQSKCEDEIPEIPEFKSPACARHAKTGNRRPGECLSCVYKLRDFEKELKEKGEREEAERKEKKKMALEEQENGSIDPPPAYEDAVRLKNEKRGFWTSIVGKARRRAVGKGKQKV